MWKTATIVFGGLTIATPVVVELLRALIHRRRARNGAAGTQDIAMFGTFFGIATLVGTLVSGLAWWMTAQ